MKYVVITSLYRPYVRGGAEVVVDDIIQELKKNHEVHVITICPWRGLRSLFPKKTLEGGVHVMRFFPLNIFSFIDITTMSKYARMVWHLIDLCNLHSYFTVRSYLRSEKPNCVFTHNIKGVGYTIPLAIKHAGIPHVHTLHDVQLVIPSGLLYWHEEDAEKMMLNRFHSWLSKKIFGSPTFVVFPSFFLKSFYCDRGFFPSSDHRVLRNPLADYSLTAKPYRNIHTDGTIHFFVGGALNKAKGILFLCKIFHLLPESTIHLWVAGSGPDANEITNICTIDQRITFLGRLTHNEIMNELSRMHYTVIPSLCYENAPTIITESFSESVPVLVANIGGASEGVEDGLNGFIFHPDDPQSLTQSLLRAMKYDDYTLLCQRARASIAGRSCSEYVKKLIQIQTP